MDKSAMGHDFIGKVDKHDSQKDYKTGFGGKFGVQNDRVDKSAVGWEHVEKVDKHNSQQGKLEYSFLCSPLRPTMSSLYINFVLQIIRKDLVENSEFRLTDKTNLLLDGITLKK